MPLSTRMLSSTRKPVKTVHSGPRKDTERFGCNSHIGQLNATTSALSLPFAYGIHMLMMSLFFFFFFLMRMCMCVCVCCLFLSCVFFSPVLPPLLPFSLYRQTKRCRKFGFIFSLFEKEKYRYTHAIFLLLLAWWLKGRFDKCHSCSSTMLLISTCSAFNSREGETISLFPKQLNAL